MQTLTNKQARQVWKRLLKRYKIKQVDLSSWFHRSKRRLFRPFTRILNALDDRIMFFEYRGKNYLHVSKSWHCKVSGDILVEKLAHELTHYFQNEKQPGFQHIYLINKYKRGVWETQAELAAADVRVFLGEKIIPAKVLFDSEWRAMYKLDEEHSNRAIANYNSKIDYYHHERKSATSAMGAIVISEIKKGS